MVKEGFYGDGGIGSQVSKKAVLVESKLVCRLEELYKGGQRKMRISRTVPNEFGFFVFKIILFFKKKRMGFKEKFWMLKDGFFLF